MSKDSEALTASPSPPPAEERWDDHGRVIVTGDDRFHGYASRMREMVESLSEWGDPSLWNLDLLADAIERERSFVESEFRRLAEAGEKPWSS